MSPLRPMTPVAEKLREVNRRKPSFGVSPTIRLKRRTMERIALHSAHSGIRETATVRQCKPFGLKYTNGVEFTSVLALAGQSRKLRLEAVQNSAAPQP